MIYGRSGQTVTITRLAVIADVERLNGNLPDNQDRRAVKSGSYVIIDDAGVERLYHLAHLRADNGSLEIADAILAAKDNGR